MTTYIIIFSILFIHWVADFIYQKHEDLVKKNTSIKHLINHTATYTLFWIYPILILFILKVLPPALLLFPIMTFVAHTITDYFTSKWIARLYKEGRIHDFFIVVGFDQLLHYIQLFATFFLLLEWSTLS